jgi:hypothetical protein
MVQVDEDAALEDFDASIGDMSGGREPAEGRKEEL